MTKKEKDQPVDSDTRKTKKTSADTAKLVDSGLTTESTDPGTVPGAGSGGGSAPPKGT